MLQEANSSTQLSLQVPTMNKKSLNFEITIATNIFFAVSGRSAVTHSIGNIFINSKNKKKFRKNSLKETQTRRVRAGPISLLRPPPATGPPLFDSPPRWWLAPIHNRRGDSSCETQPVSCELFWPRRLTKPLGFCSSSSPASSLWWWITSIHTVQGGSKPQKISTDQKLSGANTSNRTRWQVLDGIELLMFG